LKALLGVPNLMEMRQEKNAIAFFDPAIIASKNSDEFFSSSWF
jgi:hypothetical protein